ncbi:Uncharacterised protein [Mycobacterium tuberculosis]|nr:Uncharacterised protein [Mycobacterium tuberculosis]
MGPNHIPQRLFRNQRRISADDDGEPVFVFKQRFGLQDSVACSKLFLLKRIFHAVSKIRLNRFSAVAYHDHRT